jgi:hypothetical protein
MYEVVHIADNCTAGEAGVSRSQGLKVDNKEAGFLELGMALARFGMAWVVGVAA